MVLARRIRFISFFLSPVCLTLYGYSKWKFLLVARANEWVKRHNLKQEEQKKNVNLRKFAGKKLEKNSFPTD